MKILGLTLGQNAGSAVYADDSIVFASSEERYTRIKSDESFPINSIRDGLSFLNLLSSDLDKVIIAGKAITIIPNLLRMYSNFSVKDHLDLMKKYWYPKLVEGKNPNILEIFEHKISKDKFPFNSELWNSINLDKITYPITKEDEAKISNFYKEAISTHLGISTDDIIQIDHHLCHGAYALYGSPIRDDNTLIFTADAWGDDLSGTISVFNVKDNKIKRVKSYNHKDFQLARIYRYTTLLLRMLPNEHEYKVMGLSPYYQGDKQEIEKVYDSMQWLDGIEFRFNKNIHDIFDYLQKNLSSFRFDQIAAGLQSYTEKILSDWFRNALIEFNADTAVFSGGVSLNVKANLRISQIPALKRFFVGGGGGDESLSIGACYAFAESHNIKSKPLESLYLGQKATYRETLLENVSSKYKVIKYNNVQQIVDKLLEEKIVATCFGRMEMGPRALGNRSILADPRKHEIIEKINTKIKSRDFWMPFAPVIMAEYANELLVNHKNLDSPFMTIAFETKNGKQRIPASIHMYDGTARPMILTKEINLRIWLLLKKFYELTGVPALVNTSFNLHGKPIVNSVSDAIEVFENSGLDVLWLESHIIEK